MAITEKKYFVGAEIAVWEHAIAEIFEDLLRKHNVVRDSTYLSTAILSALSRRFGYLSNSKIDATWGVETVREHIQEVIQAYLYYSTTMRGVQQIVAATTQVPPILRPIQRLQRWLVGMQYLPNRFFWDLDGFIFAEKDEPYTITASTQNLVLVINGVEQQFTLPIGTNISADDIIKFLNARMVGARAYHWGHRFAIETLDLTVFGSIRVKPESTADTVFGFDTTLRQNAPNTGGTGVLPFGWRISGSYLVPPPLTPESPIPPGTISRPISFDAAMFGIGSARISGTAVEPFSGLLSPVFLRNSGFELGFEEWDKSDGPEFYISTLRPYTGSRALGVITRVESVTTPDGVSSSVGVKNTIRTRPKIIPPRSLVSVTSHHRAASRGAVYTSPPGPPTVFTWLNENAVFGYMDQQFASEPKIGFPSPTFVSLLDPSVDFSIKGVKIGMAVHITAGAYTFVGVIRGVSAHQLLLDWWRPGGTGQDTPDIAHINNTTPAGSPALYTVDRLIDPTQNFLALGVQFGGTYQQRDKLRVDQTIVQQGQIVVRQQLIRDIVNITTTVNPNDTLILGDGWGSAPTPLSPTATEDGNPYHVYIRPPNTSAYAIYHLITDIPDLYDQYKKLSANISYHLTFRARDGRPVYEDVHVFRPIPGEYETVTLSHEAPIGTRTVELAIRVEPENTIQEKIIVSAFNVPLPLARGQIVRQSEIVTTVASATRLIRGNPPHAHYLIDYDVGTITVHATAAVQLGDTLEVRYQHTPNGGAEVLIDDVRFRAEADRLSTELHVSTGHQIQKIVFEDTRTAASGTLTYTALPSDGATVTIGTDTYEFDYGVPDTATVSYTGHPVDGNTLVIGGAVFEFDSDYVVSAGATRVAIGATADDTFTNLVTAINSTSSIVTASINIVTNLVTLASVFRGPVTPPITLAMSGINYTISGSTLSGGVLPGSNITIGNIGVPAYVTDNPVLVYDRFMSVVNQASTVVTVSQNPTLNQVTIRARELGLDGNIIPFTATGSGFTISPGGYLTNGTDVRAGGWIFYTGVPGDGDSVTIGTQTYEFDNDGVQSIPGSVIVTFNIADPAEVAWNAFCQSVQANGEVLLSHDVDASLVRIRAVVLGVAGNAIPFSGTLSAGSIYPIGGTLAFGVNSGFADPDAPTCTEVRDYINARANGFTASCENGKIVLTSDTVGYNSTIAVGTGTANSILGFADGTGVRHGPDATQPGWRIVIGSPPGRVVVVSHSVQPADKYFGTDWTARVWVRSSSDTVKAHAIVFFDDGNGNIIPNLPDNIGTGVVISSGTAVTGVGTKFLTELKVGDLILVENQLRQVTAITSDTALTVDTAFSPNVSYDTFRYQSYTILDPTLAPVAIPEDNAVAVQTTARDYGQFNAVIVKFLFFDVAANDTLDLVFPYLINDISKSLHVSSETVPRNKQREYKLYRMAVANPDILTEIEAGLIGLNRQIEDEPLVLDNFEFIDLKKKNIFPFSETVQQIGKTARGTIYYTNQPPDAFTITIANITYEFDSNSIVSPGNTPVVIGPTVTDTFDNFVAVVNATSAYVSATHNSQKRTVIIESLLAGAASNAIIFLAADYSQIALDPPSGVLEGGRDGAVYTRGVDYIMRYDEGQIARTGVSTIPLPSPSDLTITYSYYPGDIPFTENYVSVIKPVGTKIEPDLTCLFFFRGRLEDFVHPQAQVVNFLPIERTPDRFTHLRPAVRGRHRQPVTFSPAPPRRAQLDYAAILGTEQDATLVKTTSDGVVTTIPYGPDGWFFFSETEIELSTSTVHLAPGESALYDPLAVYEFEYYVKFQYTSPPIAIADPTSSYILVPYSYKTVSTTEEKVDAEQVLIFGDNRRATLNRAAVMDQSLSEIYRSLGGQTTILDDSSWQFIDPQTVEIQLSAFDAAATYRIVYKAVKIRVE